MREGQDAGGGHGGTGLLGTAASERGPRWEPASGAPREVSVPTLAAEPPGVVQTVGALTLVLRLQQAGSLPASRVR